MKIKNILEQVGAFVVPAIIIGVWILGAFHGSKKHNTDPFSESFFVCWYYGLETMWHKTDFTELKENVQVGTFLIMQKPDGFNAKEQLEYNETKKKFKKILTKLDQKEKDYVHAGVNSFVDYMESFQKDMIEALLSYKQSRIMNLNFSQATLSKSQKCSSFGLGKEMKDMENELDKIRANLKSNIANDPKAFDENLMDEQKMKQESINKIEVIKTTVKEIFTES